VTFFAVLLALGLAMALGHVYHEARPFVSDGDTRLLISHGADNSFPSDHATLVFAVGGAIVWWRRGMGLVCLGLALLTGISRIYVGVHWPLDVLGSALAGVLAGAALARGVPLLETPQRWFSRMLPVGLVASPPTAGR
jgi:undecaprenyl-diphosphatase